jgi:hypothetical protein
MAVPKKKTSKSKTKQRKKVWSGKASKLVKKSVLALEKMERDTKKKLLITMNSKIGFGI